MPNAISRGGGLPAQPENHTVSHTPVDTKDFHKTVNRVLDVLKDGKMDIARFLDALCWGNRMAIVDPTVRYTRTSLMNSV